MKWIKLWDHPRKKNMTFNENLIQPFLMKKTLISETVRSRAKRTIFSDHQENKTYLTEKLGHVTVKKSLFVHLTPNFICDD